MCIDDKRSAGYRTCKWTWMQKRTHIIEGTMYMCSYIYVHMGKKNTYVLHVRIHVCVCILECVRKRNTFPYTLFEFICICKVAHTYTRKYVCISVCVY